MRVFLPASALLLPRVGLGSCSARHARPAAAPPLDRRDARRDGRRRPRARARARCSQGDALAAVATAFALSGRASHGASEQALRAVAAEPSLGAELRGEASLAARALSAEEGGDASAPADRALGVVTDVAVLGPFRDTGGGVRAKEGPEAPGASFSDMRARYSWGSVDVSWRAVPRGYAGAAGVPLDSRQPADGELHLGRVEAHAAGEADDRGAPRRRRAGAPRLRRRRRRPGGGREPRRLLRQARGQGRRRRRRAPPRGQGVRRRARRRRARAPARDRRLWRAALADLERGFLRTCARPRRTWPSRR